MADERRPPKTQPIPRLARVKQLGLVGTLEALRARIRPWRIRGHGSLVARFSGSGVEIGGPSAAFGERGLLPIYPNVDRLDKVNFSASTLWEASLVDGGAFRYADRRTPGRQYIREATVLKGLADRHYDFVISSHTLEHIAN